MKKVFSIYFVLMLWCGAATAQGKYAGTKKTLIGKEYTDSRTLPGLKGWTWMEGNLANSIDDPESITSDIFKKGTTWVLLFSIMEDTASGKYKVVDVVEIAGVAKGWTVRSLCRQNEQENNYIIAWGKENTAPYMKLIKKAWKFDPDRRRINVIPVKGIDCENVGC